MKPADHICKIDKLGRVLIPKALRSKLDLRADDPVEVFIDGESIVLAKYRKRCAFCDSEDDLLDFKGKFICSNCHIALSNKK